MLGDDAPHDGQTEAASPSLRRIVREKQLVALDGRDPGAIVGDHDTHEPIRPVQLGFDNDLALPIHGFDGVIDEVDDDAPQLFDVKAYERDVVRKTPNHGDVVEETVVERQRLGDELREIRRHRSRGRHPRELRELVDQTLERFDFPDDRGRALVDEFTGAGRASGEMAAQTLGRELNRRQRVLDFVREPPRHFTPRRHFLGPDEWRHIIEHQQLAGRLSVVFDKGGGDRCGGRQAGQRQGVVEQRRLGVLDDATAQEIKNDALETMRAGISEAEAEPEPDPELVFDNAYVLPPANVREGWDG